jgi:NitT/TauT family transport system substrate-binding protein
MPSDPDSAPVREHFLAWMIGATSAGWLVLITMLHFWLNVDRNLRPTVVMGYMPVITNLAAPLLDQGSLDKGPVRFRALKFASFAEMAEALRNDQIQAAFIIAPLAIVLRQQGADVKVVYIGNRHESTLVVRKGIPGDTFSDLAGRTVAVPMRYSGHNLSIRRLMDLHGLQDAIDVVEMNPPDMPAALAAGALDAYYVGEPFAAQTLRNGDSKRLFYVEEIWPGFICNLMIVNQTFIEANPEAVQMLVQGAARSGYWARRNLSQAAKIAAAYWNQTQDLVEYALTTPPNRIVFDRFVPRQAELQEIADMMAAQGLATSRDISGLVDDRFAINADLGAISTFESIMNSPGE